MPARRGSCWKSVLLMGVGVLLVACAGSPKRASHGDLRFVDTESAGRLRHAAAVGRGASALAPAATRSVAASILAQSVPVLLTLLDGDNAVGELEARLVECSRLAERQVNAEFFGNRAPTREECGEEVEVDGCGERITRAMLLGQRKHVVALQCARELKDVLGGTPFLISPARGVTP